MWQPRVSSHFRKKAKPRTVRGCRRSSLAWLDCPAQSTPRCLYSISYEQSDLLPPLPSPSLSPVDQREPLEPLDSAVNVGVFDSTLAHLVGPLARHSQRVTPGTSRRATCTSYRTHSRYSSRESRTHRRDSQQSTFAIAGLCLSSRSNFYASTGQKFTTSLAPLYASSIPYQHAFRSLLRLPG